MRTAIVILLGEFFCGWLCGDALRTSSATIEVYVLSFIEEPLDRASIRLIDQYTGKELDQKFTSSGALYRATSVPYTEYLLKVGRDGFRSHEQLLPVYQPRMSLRVFLRLSRVTDESPTEVLGTVKPPPGPNERLWVKMLPLLTTEVIGETQVEPDGRFRFTGLDDGEYVVVVMKGIHSVFMKHVKLYGALHIIAELPAKLPDP